MNCVENEIHFLLVCPLYHHLRLKYLLIPEHLGFYQSHSNFIRIMSSENSKVVRNFALFVYKAFQLRTKIGKCLSLSRTLGRGSGDGNGSLGWVVQVLLGCSRMVALWCSWGFGGCARDFMVFSISWSGCGLFPLEALVFLGAHGPFLLSLLGACESLGRHWCSGCAAGVLARVLGPVLVLLVSSCCGCFWICSSEVLERPK